ncbi:MAG: PIN domain-containing protein [Anaerolineae bacterium]|jgi:predicted nucleic acid-binding protein
MTRLVLADSSALFAMVDSRDRHAPAARTFLLESQDASYLVPDTVFCEAMTLIKARLGAVTAVEVGSRIQASTRFRLQHVEPADHRATWEIFARYADKDWSYVDCSVLALAQRMKILEVFAFDHHFDQMGGLGLTRVP